ncbi:MAG: autotransporter domain-containing protein [Sneathiellaceae bacterium]
MAAWLVSAAVLPVLSGGIPLPGPAAAQTAEQPAFVAQGPAPFSTSATVRDSATFGWSESTGAARIVAPHPTDPAILYAGAANGGIWRSDTAGQSWTPLTDSQSSLSVGGLALAPGDPDHLVAGIGRFSTAGGQGGALTGILESHDGGATWSHIDLQAMGVASGFETGLSSVVFSGSTVLAGAVNQVTDGTRYQGTSGLFRRTEGGSFAPVGVAPDLAASDPAKPMPLGAPVSTLAVDPSDPDVVYAGVDKAGSFSGIYRSTDGGATWQRETDSLPAETLTGIVQQSQNMRVTVGPDGAAYALIADDGGRGERIALGIRRDPSSGSWSVIEIPAQFAETNQADPHMAIAVNPDDPDILYAAGDPNSFWRGRRDPATGTITWESGIDGSLGAPHVDYRSIVFDAAGRMLVGTDGGVYATTSLTETGPWSSLNQGLATAEFYRVAWNPISHTAAGAAQDNGVFLQRSPDNAVWDGINDLGDGVNVAVNALTFADRGQAIVYSTTQSLGDLRAQVFDANNAQVGPTVIIDIEDEVIDNPRSVPFDSPILLNRTNPQLMALGTTQVVVGLDNPDDPGTFYPEQGVYVRSLELRDLTEESGAATFSGAAAAMDFGTRTASGANSLLVGVANNLLDPDSPGALYYIGDATDVDERLIQLPLTEAIEAVKSVRFDPDVDNQFFATSDRSVLRFTAANCPLGGAACTPSDMATGLPDSFRDPRGIEVIAANGVRALLVGGFSATGPVAGGSNLYAVLDDATGSWAGTDWFATGGTLPNAAIWSLEYAEADDVLLVGTLGRGAWALYDASTSLFPLQVAELRFGLADNDSAPAASILTDLPDGSARALRKSGSGTLTLTGSASYSGGTFIDGGRVSIAADESLGDAAGGVTFNGGTLGIAAPVTSGRAMSVDAGGATFDTAALTTLTGSLSGTGAVTKTGISTLRLTGTGSLPAGTTIAAGLLQVDGSLTGPVSVQAGGGLGGTGSIVGNVSAAGTVQPGASIGTLTVDGDFAMADGAELAMEIGQESADKLVVTGTAALDGTLALSAADGVKLAGQSYTLVQAGTVTGAFDQVIALSPFLTAAFGNSGSALQASFARDFAAPAQGANQAAIGAALNRSYTLGSQGDMDAVYDALDDSGSDSLARNALDQLSGQSLGDMTTAAAVNSGLLARGMQARLARRRAGTTGLAAGAIAPLALADRDAAGMTAIGAALAGGGTGLSAGDAAGQPAALSERTDAWVRLLGRRGHVDSDGNGTGYDGEQGGIQVGIDRTFGDRFVAGLSLAWLRSDLHAKEVTAQTDGDTYQVGVYGSADLGPVDLDLTAAYARTDWRTSRSLAFGGLNRTATAAPAGNDIAMTARIGRDIAMGRFTVTPQAGLDWYRLQRDGFSESGAGAANLNVAGSSSDVVQTSLGARAATLVGLGDSLVLRPELRGAWLHDLAQADPQVSATLAGAPAAPFTVAAATPGRDAAVLGVNLTGGSGGMGALRLFADYELQLAARQAGHAVTLGLRYAW